ncbi:heterokaryon incompatibility protein-domain-containing protein [Lasiosphaeris hirsuta]|uniref:Heterokaryon incompatibility protein-domain-containing protein n=1 Tax=Lasiosphaeris hirsuta TaxID=260670 RepID=A0AA40AYZ9_9PEZI|nr:heterokaryon incompatibility protein-domain-containing protein [Lasiosphaeris hirsuta]
MPHLCASCLALGLTRADFENPPFVPEGKYHSIALRGTIGDLRIREAGCGLCRLLLHALSREARSQPELLSDRGADWEAEWMQNAFEYDPNADGAEAKYGSALYPKFKAATGSSNYGVQLVDDAATTVPLRGRAISDEVDMERVASWIRRCREEHGPRCVEGYLAAADHPIGVPGFFVIDVNRKCLTTLPGGMEYVALSYVWGKSSFVNTTKSNVDLFRIDGAFGRVRLPKTIRDAIEVAARLRYRFLWVDAVCIVQDDDSTKPLLIRSMDAVYGNAALTIIAASGTHAAAGFLRSRNRVNGDPESSFAVQEISLGFSLGVIPFLDGELMHCPHAQRGWTFQEGCRSPRCLVFLDGLAYFVCRTSVWREDLVAESSDFSPFEGANVLGKTSSEWP